MPFVDPITRDKVKFNPKIFEAGYFTPDMVMKEWWNGTQDFEYVHEKYWPQLVVMCEERAKEQIQNWKELGGTVGISEWKYKMKSKSYELAEKEAEVTVTAVAPLPMAITTDAPVATVAAGIVAVDNAEGVAAAAEGDGAAGGDGAAE